VVVNAKTHTHNYLIVLCISVSLSRRHTFQKPYMDFSDNLVKLEKQLCPVFLVNNYMQAFKF